MRLLLHVIVASLATFGAVAAQVTVRIESGSFSAVAGSQSQSVQYPNGLRASASDRQFNPPYSCSGSAQASGATQSTGASVLTTATSSGNCGPPLYWGMQASGSATMVVRLSAPTPIAGTIQITSNVIFASVDVGDDGSRESGTLSVVVTPAGIPIKLSASASATAPFVPGASASAAVTFTASPSKLATSLSPCGAELEGWSSSSASSVRLDFVGQSAVQTGAAFFVVGLNRQNIAIPPLNCVLGTDILIPALVTLSPTGRSTLRVSLTPPSTAVTFHAQFLVGALGPGGTELWRTSNLLDVTIP